LELLAGGEESGENKFRQDEGARSTTFNWSCWQAMKSPGEANLDKMKGPGVLCLSEAAGKREESGRSKFKQIEGASSATFNWSCRQAGESPGETNLDKMEEPGILS
jgi:hypothetical protein